MRALDRLRLIEKIGAQLQTEMTTSDINVYLQQHSIVHEWENVASSKRLYVKAALGKAPLETVLKIAGELGIGNSAVIETTGSDFRKLLEEGSLSLTDFNRALEEIDRDAPTAIGLAATTLESVCKAILDQCDQTYPAAETLMPLMKATLPLLRLSPDQHADDDIRKILAGLLNVADGLATLRNKYSSFHGKGKGQHRLIARHARLAVSSMASIAYFLIETYRDQKTRDHA